MFKTNLKFLIFLYLVAYLDNRLFFFLRTQKENVQELSLKCPCFMSWTTCVFLCFLGAVYISKVILSLRLCLGILGRAGIVHYLSCFCADLVCNCIPSGCCLPKAVEDTSSSDTGMQMCVPSEHLRTQ